MGKIILPHTDDERLERVCNNLRDFPRRQLRKPLPERPETAIICGFGPSLQDTWASIPSTPNSVVITTSGAHDFLIERGIIPTFHIESDPREHKLFFLKDPHQEVTYLLCSTCHPKMFFHLRNHKVTMWHGYTDTDVARQVASVARWDRKIVHLSGGTNIGQRAIIVARHLGFRSFILHGFDCCYWGEQQWAGAHSGKRHHTVLIRVEGRVFETSDIMMSSTDDFFREIVPLAGCTFRIDGGGLLATRWEMFQRDRKKAMTWGWWEPVNFELKARA